MHPVTTAHGLILYELSTESQPVLEVVDVTVPTRPRLDCMLSPAQGGQFSASGTAIRYFNAGHLGLADLTIETVTDSAQLPVAASEGAFSRDGSKFAYRVYDDTGAMTAHVFSGGRDQVLYTQPPVGGHGGAPGNAGPFDQLQFSPDGSLLLDYQFFRPTGGVDNLMVFNAAGTAVLQELGQASGTWAPSGATLYYPVWGEGGPTGEVDSFNAVSGSQKVASGLNGFYWPAGAPDGKTIVFNAFDSSVPNCGGLPHLWHLDLATGRSVQVSKSVSSHPVFVTASVVWSDHETPTQCGPGGPSAPDGIVIAHDLLTGADVAVDMRQIATVTADAGNVLDMLL